MLKIVKSEEMGVFLKSILAQRWSEDRSHDIVPGHIFFLGTFGSVLHLNLFSVLSSIPAPKVSSPSTKADQKRIPLEVVFAWAAQYGPTYKKT